MKTGKKLKAGGDKKQETGAEKVEGEGSKDWNRKPEKLKRGEREERAIQKLRSGELSQEN
ncbi:MAG: hypothetical protein II950_01050 [Prevotella sp.]|nr:hypothetical protein [Prevotella sp.]